MAALEAVGGCPQVDVGEGRDVGADETGQASHTFEDLLALMQFVSVAGGSRCGLHVHCEAFRVVVDSADGRPVGASLCAGPLACGDCAGRAIRHVGPMWRYNC